MLLFKDGLQTGAGHGGYFSKYFSLFFAFCLDRAVFDFCAKNFKMLMFFWGWGKLFRIIKPRRCVPWMESVRIESICTQLKLQLQK